MNKIEFMEGIHILQDNYNQKFSAEKLKLYYENLKNMNHKKYINKINELIKTNKFIPNIAEILDKKQALSDFEQRDYSDFDFSTLYANKGEWYK